MRERIFTQLGMLIKAKSCADNGGGAARGVAAPIDFREDVRSYGAIFSSPIRPTEMISSRPPSLPPSLIRRRRRFCRSFCHRDHSGAIANERDAAFGQIGALEREAPFPISIFLALRESEILVATQCAIHTYPHLR